MVVSLERSGLEERTFQPVFAPRDIPTVIVMRNCFTPFLKSRVGLHRIALFNIVFCFRYGLESGRLISLIRAGS